MAGVIERRRWHVFWAKISHSAIVWNRRDWNTLRDESLGSLLLRILSIIFEKAAERDSDLLAYFDIYCNAVFILRISFKFTFMRQSWSCNQSYRLMNRSFLAVINSGFPLSLCKYIFSVISFGYSNLQYCWPARSTQR